MTERASALVTILFTDLVGSTELLSRAGDEDAQRIFRAHHTLLADTAAAHGGTEVKWLGDGLMAAFSSAADALRCAIAYGRRHPEVDVALEDGRSRQLAGAGSSSWPVSRASARPA